MAAPAPLALDWNVLEPHLRRVVDLINTAAAAAAVSYIKFLTYITKLTNTDLFPVICIVRTSSKSPIDLMP